MLEPQVPPVSDDAPLSEWQSRAESLEQQLVAVQKDAAARLLYAELKVEAVRAGIIDLDGLKLVDLTTLRMNDAGEIDGGTQLISELKRSKPWLFGAVSSSSIAQAPAAQPPRQKRATEMTDEEYRTARAALLRMQT